MSDAEQPGPPLLRVVRGNPSDEELAALVAVVAARLGGGGAEEPPAPSAWAAPAARLRRPLTVGPGAWVLSGREPGVRTRAGW